MGFFLRCSLPYHKNPGWEWPTVGEHLVPPQVSKPPMDCWTLVRSVARRANLLRSRSGSPAATSHGTQRWWRLMARANCLRWEEALPGTSSSLLLHWCRSFLGWRVGGIERWLMTSMVFPVKFFSPWAENLYHLGILPRIPNGSIGNWFWSRIRMSFWTLWGTAWRRRGERWRVGEWPCFCREKWQFQILILPLPVLLSVMMWTLNNILPTHVESTTTQPAKVPKALDVGCGSGREAILLATRGWEVWVRRWEDSHAGGKRDFFWTQMRVFVARRAMM